MKTRILQQKKHGLGHDIKRKKVFELQENGSNLSLMRINYKLTKRGKTKKYKKNL